MLTTDKYLPISTENFSSENKNFWKAFTNSTTIAISPNMSLNIPEGIGISFGLGSGVNPNKVESSTF